VNKKDKILFQPPYLMCMKYKKVLWVLVCFFVSQVLSTQKYQVELLKSTKEKNRCIHNDRATHSQMIFDGECDGINHLSSANYEKTDDKMITQSECNKFNPSTNICEYCHHTNTKKNLLHSKLCNLKLCHACTEYEKNHDKLIPRTERKNFRFKSMSDICEYCGHPSTNKRLVQSKLFEFKLCHICYCYEQRHGVLVPQVEKAPKLTNICEYCDRPNKKQWLANSKLHELKLCVACYQDEKKHGVLRPLAERVRIISNNSSNICEYCERTGGKKYLSKQSELNLCQACWKYEKDHGKLIPREDRRHVRSKLSPNICCYCDRPNSGKCLLWSKLSEFRLCQACYGYETKHGFLLPINDRAPIKKAANKQSDSNDLQEEAVATIIQNNGKRYRDGLKKENQSKNYNKNIRHAKPTFEPTDDMEASQFKKELIQDYIKII